MAKRINYREPSPPSPFSMPDGQGVLLDDVGHIPHLEAPDRFQDLLSEFLDRK